MLFSLYFQLSLIMSCHRVVLVVFLSYSVSKIAVHIAKSCVESFPKSQEISE